MAGTVWLIADRSEAVIQPDMPSAQMAAWLLPIPDGSNGLAAAAAFVETQKFPLGTRARVIDMTITPLKVLTFRLSSTWVEET